jgi:hypothetical protein
MWYLYLVGAWLLIAFILITLSPKLDTVKLYKYQEIRVEHKKSGSTFKTYSVKDGFKRTYYDVTDKTILLKRAKFTLFTVEGNYHGEVARIPSGFKKCTLKGDYLYLGDSRLSYINEYRGNYEVIIDNKKGEIFMKV